MKNVKVKIVGGVIAIILLVVFFNSTFSVQENEYALVKQLGKVVSVKEEAGLNFKLPFIQSVTTIPKENQLYDLASSDVMTSDKKSMIADCYVIWKIEDPLKYYQSLRSSVSNAGSRIDTAVYNSMKNVISSLEQDQLIEGKDGTLSNIILQDLGDDMNKEYGISIEKVEMKQLDLPSDNKEAVYQRMISEREKIAAQFTAEGDSQAQQIKNDVNYEVRVKLSTAEKEAKNIIAEGEAEYMRIIQEAYGNPERKEFYEFLRGLDATKASLTEGTMLIIDDEYPIVDNLKTPNKTE